MLEPLDAPVSGYWSAMPTLPVLTVLLAIGGVAPIEDPCLKAGSEAANSEEAWRAATLSHQGRFRLLLVDSGDGRTSRFRDARWSAHGLVLLDDEGASHQVDWERIQAVDVQDGSHAGGGAVAGAFLGLALGAMVGVNIEPTDEFGLSRIGPALIAIPLAAVIGAIAGSNFAQWRTVYCRR